MPAGVVNAQRAGAFGGPFSPQVVTGHPYSAEEDTQTIRTLGDGTHITLGVQKTMIYRDSLGRTRTERTPRQMPGPLGAGSTPPVFIEVTDPVAGYRYVFDSNSTVVHRSRFGQLHSVSKLPPATAVPLPAQLPAQAQLPTQVESSGKVVRTLPAVASVRPEIVRESLGSENIEGVLADGQRITTTWPVDSIGNDRPVTAIDENWFSRELGRMVLSRLSDPRSGETTIKLTNISLAEPPASLFGPPAGYQIEDPAVPQAAR
jgi:hypothetical protein